MTVLKSLGPPEYLAIFVFFAFILIALRASCRTPRSSGFFPLIALSREN